jgi:4-aminobutyrate aminotransferase-like enzyme
MQVLISTDGPYDNVLKIKPPLVISEQDIDYFLKCFEEVLDEPEKWTV